MSEYWHNNAVQFTRLVAELEACGAFTPQVMLDLSESMDLTHEEISELVDRAQTDWEAIKNRHCPPSQRPASGVRLRLTATTIGPLPQFDEA